MNQRSKRLVAVTTVMLGIFVTATVLLGFAITSIRPRDGSASAIYMFLVGLGIVLLLVGVIARRRFGALAPTLPQPKEQL